MFYDAVDVVLLLLSLKSTEMNTFTLTLVN